jgi:hypothetical protein
MSGTALEGHFDMTIFTEHALCVTLKVLERPLVRVGGAATYRWYFLEKVQIVVPTEV